ncbi:MAG: TRAM domain-containing protein, partial [Prevotella sp.]
RLNELIHLQTEMSALANKRDEGKEFDVLVEGFSKRSREQLCGRNEQNKMVVFDKGNHHIGETVRVKITGSSSATLLGEEVAPSQPPRGEEQSMHSAQNNNEDSNQSLPLGGDGEGLGGLKGGMI